MKITLDVKEVKVLLTNGTDRICLELNAPTPYPEMKYEATACIEARYGYGETWCKEVLGITPKVINARTLNPEKFNKK
jgi:hypothetical protein